MSFSTAVLKCNPQSIQFPSHTPEITDSTTLHSLQTAASHLKSKECVAFPTETVYGLGALALDSSATAKIFATKGRPPDNPLIVHVSNLDMLKSLLPHDYEISRMYSVLMKHFWPGALTLLFPRDANVVPDVISAGLPAVAVRMPSHPVARALIALSEGPIAAPSANSSGRPSPTKAEHVLQDLNGKLPVIIDGGPCGIGLESTVVDGLHADGHLRVLRPGGITVEDLERVLHQELEVAPKVLVYRRDFRDEALEQAPTTPGMKYRHYSPSAPVTLLLTTGSQPSVPVLSYLDSLRGDRGSPLKVGIMALDDSPLGQYTMPTKGFVWQRFSLGPRRDPSIAAQRLFDGLISLDKQGVDIILIEEVAEEREGLAVMNRVRKAVGNTVRVSLSMNRL